MRGVWHGDRRIQPMSAAFAFRCPSSPRSARRSGVRTVPGYSLCLLVEIHAEPSAPPPRRGKHAGIVRRVRLALAPRLRPGLVAVEGVSVEMRPDVGADADAEFPDGRRSRAYVTPDLTVCPSQFLASDESFLHPQAVDIAVGVVAAGLRTDRRPDRRPDLRPDRRTVERQAFAITGGRGCPLTRSGRAPARSPTAPRHPALRRGRWSSAGDGGRRGARR